MHEQASNSILFRDTGDSSNVCLTDGAARINFFSTPYAETGIRTRAKLINVSCHQGVAATIGADDDNLPVVVQRVEAAAVVRNLGLLDGQSEKVFFMMRSESNRVFSNILAKNILFKKAMLTNERFEVGEIYL